MESEDGVERPSRGHGVLGLRAADTMVRSGLSVPREEGTPRAEGGREGGREDD